MTVTILDRYAAPPSAPPPSGDGEHPEDDGPLYAARKKIYTTDVKGTFRRNKWLILLVTLGIYYTLPFIRWDRGPNLPDQAVLVDLENARFYFFFIRLWPQEVYYFTGLLVLAALTLFLMNAVAGRVWCGYLCPQTVWTDLFMKVERFFEGDRRERLKRDAGPWTLESFASKAGTHITWFLIAWWTGGAWVLYFADAPTLVSQLATGTAPAMAWIWIAILTATTYLLAGHLREQVCTYMCPWPRIQAALIDEDALNVTYRFDRGEPRLSLKAAAKAREAGEPAGDCIDCLACVYVCPTGIDIRQGPNLACIQCGLCIDACDRTMEKIGRPPRLIAYDTMKAVEARAEKRPAPPIRIIRPRTALYVAVIALVGSLMLWSLATRDAMTFTAQHDRAPLFVTLKDGGIRNAYTLMIGNKEPVAHRFEIRVAGLPGAAVSIEGEDPAAVQVAADETRNLRVFVTAPRAEKSEPSRAVRLILINHVTQENSEIAEHFFGP